MLRFTRVAQALQGDKRVSGRRGHPFGLQDWEKEAPPKWELLNATYGWHRNMLPKFYAGSDYMRQMRMRRMLTELVRRDHIIVAGARGPAVRIMADRVVALAKAGDTTSRQSLAFFLQDPLLVDKAFDEYPKRFSTLHGSYCMATKLRTRRRRDNMQMWMLEMKNRAMSDNHKGEDYSRGPERFFLPPRVIESDRGVVRPPHMQMAFDRWASKYKTEEFHHWWKMRHAKMRFWGHRGIPHPSDVEPLWTEKDEEEWHSDMLAAGDGSAYDLDAEEPGLLAGSRPAAASS